MNDLSKISSFFNQYNKLNESVNISQHGDELELVQSFFSSIDPLIQEFKEYELAHAPNYNIFSILRIKTLEAIVHTPFLADLLDKKGEHKQGTLFFNLFAESFIFNSPGVENIILQKTSQEVFTRFGIIDILISCLHQGQPYYILIENKVYANDGEKQLERYFNYLDKSLNIDKSQYKIIYLTPDGSPPAIPTSISRDLYNKLKADENLIEISYKEDITAWINRSIEVSKPEPVKQILIQYLQTIKNL